MLAIQIFVTIILQARTEENMEIGDKVVLRIQQLLDERNITLNKLAALSGLHQSTLNNIMHRINKNATIKTIDFICKGLGISLVDFFESEVFR